MGVYVYVCGGGGGGMLCVPCMPLCVLVGLNACHFNLVYCTQPFILAHYSFDMACSTILAYASESESCFLFSALSSLKGLCGVCSKLALGHLRRILNVRPPCVHWYMIIQCRILHCLVLCCTVVDMEIQ